MHNVIDILVNTLKVFHHAACGFTAKAFKAFVSEKENSLAFKLGREAWQDLSYASGVLLFSFSRLRLMC